MEQEKNGQVPEKKGILVRFARRVYNSMARESMDELRGRIGKLEKKISALNDQVKQSSDRLEKRVARAEAAANKRVAQAEAAVNAGFHRATHVFNGMVPFAHREPGLLGAALTDPRIECEMICDLVHLSAPAVKLVLLAKGAARVTAISDAVSGAGLGDGEHELGGVKYRISGGVARLPDGTICGSCRTLDAALVNLLSLGVAPGDAARICSANPARALGAEDAGGFYTGMRADFVTVDEAGTVESVYLAGERVR